MDGGDVNPFLLADLLTANKDATLTTKISKLVATCYEILPGNFNNKNYFLKLLLISQKSLTSCMEKHHATEKQRRWCSAFSLD